VTDGGCPAGYTRACATAGPDYNGKPVSTVTCCPRFVQNSVPSQSHIPSHRPGSAR
jgi:hypothetical protein